MPNNETCWRSSDKDFYELGLEGRNEHRILLFSISSCESTFLSHDYDLSFALTKWLLL